MTKPLSHVLVPPIVFTLLWSVSWFGVMYSGLKYAGKGYEEAVDTSIGATCFMLVPGILVSIKVTEFLYMRLDAEYRQRCYEAESVRLPTRKRVEPVEYFEIRNVYEKPEVTEVDYFRGIKPEVWREVAARIAINDDFTNGTVGQTRRPKFIEILEPAECVRKVPGKKGEYELTDKGRAFWRSLAARPPHLWDIPPKLLQNLG